MRSFLDRRGPLLAYIFLFVVAAILVNSVGTKVFNHYVNNKVQQVLHTQQVCREGAPDEVKNCRALIDRVTHAATAKQEHETAIRLFRTLSGKEIHELGLQGPRGRSGTTRIIRIIIHENGAVRTVTITKPTPAPKAKPKKNNPKPKPKPAPKVVAPAPVPPFVPPLVPITPSPNDPPGPVGNPGNHPCPPRNPHC